MAGISIGIKPPEYPEWVNEVFEAMPPEAREQSIKTGIYSACYKQEDGQFRIIPFVSAMSNRVPVLPEAKDVVTALVLVDVLYPWTYLPGDSTQESVCKHCGYTFTTRLCGPQCPFCYKYEWQDLEAENGK